MTKIIPPLLAEEIFIVQLHGTFEEAERLELLLDEATCRPDDSPSGAGLSRSAMNEVFKLAEIVRKREKIGLHWECCWRCKEYITCVERLSLQEADVRTTCCRLCASYDDCKRRCRE